MYRACRYLCSKVYLCSLPAHMSDRLGAATVRYLQGVVFQIKLGAETGNFAQNTIKIPRNVRFSPDFTHLSDQVGGGGKAQHHQLNRILHRWRRGFRHFLAKTCSMSHGQGCHNKRTVQLGARAMAGPDPPVCMHRWGMCGVGESVFGCFGSPEMPLSRLV